MTLIEFLLAGQCALLVGIGATLADLGRRYFQAARLRQAALDDTANCTRELLMLEQAKWQNR